MKSKLILKNTLFYICLIILFAIGLHLVFYKLGSTPIERYDEGRHGVSAYEMLKNHNYIVNTFNYVYDYWNLKPPLSYWAIAISYKLFGFNVIGLKCCSAVSFMATLVSVAFFMKRKFGRAASLISIYFILTLGIITGDHMARYADADCLYIFFYIFGFILLLCSEKNKFCFALCGFATALAFLTKSYHAFTMIACTAIYIVLSGNLKKYKSIHYISYLLCVFGPIFIWAAMRYAYDGWKFLSTMVTTDVLKRSSSVLEGHEGSFWYYAELIWKELMVLLIITGVCVIIDKIMKRKFKPDAAEISFLVWIFVPLIAFSSVQSKLAWYIYPQMILIPMFMGYLTGKVFDNNTVIKVIVLSMLVIPSIKIGYNIKTLGESKNTHKDQLLLMDVLRRDENFSGKNIYFDLTTKEKSRENNEQELYLISELYGDMKAKTEGTDGFLEDMDCYLVTTDYLYNIIPKLKKYELLIQRDGYCVLKK